MHKYSGEKAVIAIWLPKSSVQTVDSENGDLQYYYSLGLKYSWLNLIREEKPVIKAY